MLAPPQPPARPRALLVLVTAIAVPVLWISVDVVVRRALLPYLNGRLRWTYALGILLSLLFWGLCMETARHPRRGVRIGALVLLGVTAAFGIGGQAFFRLLTSGYANRDAIMLALGVHGIVTSFVGDHAVRMLVFFLTPAGLVVALAIARARRFGHLDGKPWTRPVAAGAVTLGTMFVHISAHTYQCLPPDVLWINGSGGPILAALGLAAPPRAMPAGQHTPLPVVSPAQPDAPPIVVLLGESVSRDEVCVTRTAGCTKSPRLDEAAPDRIGFPRSFTPASCTDLASVALWTGLPITATPDALAHAPLLWDYAKARGYRTAYLSSQSLLFQHLDLYLRTSAIDRIREARDREADPHIDLGTPDATTVGEAADFIEEPGGPAFVLVQFANTHSPYQQTPGFTPYPTVLSPTVSVTEAAKNVYRNAIFHNDAVIGDFIARLRKSERGRRTIVISLSDHGEAFGRHQSFMHTWDLYGEQINIPIWIDAPKGSLPDEVLARLRLVAPVRPVVTIDLAATVLDLLGALDEPALHEQVAHLGGTSLFRPLTAARDVLLWNCPPTRECTMDAFGVVRWPRKLHYVGRDARYVCHDLSVDPEENVELPRASCKDLRAVLDATFGTRAETGDHGSGL